MVDSAARTVTAVTVSDNNGRALSKKPYPELSTLSLVSYARFKSLLIRPQFQDFLSLSNII